jgi:RNA polymerase sigma factor (sigma-70 family)
MTANDLDLLRQFTRDHSQDAFTALVKRHVNLVYSAALRQVRLPQLAEEITQSVFADLARDAGKLKPDTILTAWLYAVARRTAIDVIRKESRRQLREQIAVEMTNMNATANEWRQIEPLLDDAMAALDETDRSAILLRYFENKNLREVGESLKISDDAAQKRVSRATERLREFFSKRNITVGASGLAVLISANAVQSAPIGLAATISAAAVLAGTAVHTSTIITATKIIAMTTLQKTVVTAALAAVAGAGIYEARHAAQLREQIETLRQLQAPLADQIQQLQRERDDATNQVAGLVAENMKLAAKSNPDELLKLRGQVGSLRTQLAQIKADLPQPRKVVPQNDYVNLALAEVREEMTNSTAKKIAGLKAKIGLTAEQERQMNDILQGDIEARAQNQVSVLTSDHSTADVKSQEKILNASEDAQIEALLTPDQQAAYQELNQEQAAGAAMNFAKLEAAGMNSYLDLTPEQSQVVVSILASLPPGQGGQGNAQDADAKEQLEIRLQALSQTLTPDQREKYRAQKLAAIQQAELGIQMMKSLAK